MTENLTPASVTAPVAVVAPVEAVQVAPVVQAPVVAPVVEAAPAPVVAAPVQVADTVLGEALSKPVVAPAQEVKPVVVEVKPVTQDLTKTQEGKSDEPAPPPVYDPFTFPEGISLDKERVSKFTGILGELERGGKVDHALVQQFGQKAVDFHIEEVKKATEELNTLYKTSWERQKTEWKDSFLKDPNIGGERAQGTVEAALNFIRTHGGTPEQQTEFRNLMETSGLGNHPAMIRMLAAANSSMAEGKPLAAQKPVLAPKSRVSTMYGSMPA